ncbi:MAG: tol-pal system protein YbgF [Gallionella sp.]
MLKHAFILLALCCISPAQAGLFSDDEARAQAQLVQTNLDRSDALAQDRHKQQTQAILDLQTQIEALSIENRTLRGQNEELAHGLQSAEKREKDFYIDLDTRLRRIESSGVVPPAANENAAATPATTATLSASADAFDPTVENRILERGFVLLKGRSYTNATRAFGDFIKQYPESVQIPNAIYGLGNALYGDNDYKSALLVYQNFLKDYPETPRSPEVLLNMAACQQALKQTREAKITLKQLIKQYPKSDAAAKAKKQLATLH